MEKLVNQRKRKINMRRVNFIALQVVMTINIVVFGMLLGYSIGKEDCNIDDGSFDDISNTDDEEYVTSERTVKEIANIVSRETKGFDVKYTDSDIVFWQTLSVMQRVAANISSFNPNDFNYNAQYQNYNSGTPAEVAEKAIHFLYGQGESKAFIIMKVLERLGISSREIQFWNIDGNQEDSHSAIEVYYNNKWHYFDPTNELFFMGDDKDVLSVAEIKKLGKDELENRLVISQTSLLNQTSHFEGTTNTYLGSEADVSVDGNVTLHVSISEENDFHGIPNYCGKNINANGVAAETKLIFTNIGDASRISLKYDYASCEKLVVLNMRNQKRQEIQINQNDNSTSKEMQINIDLKKLDYKKNDEIKLIGIPYKQNINGVGFVRLIMAYAKR